MLGAEKRCLVEEQIESRSDRCVSDHKLVSGDFFDLLNAHHDRMWVK